MVEEEKQTTHKEEEDGTAEDETETSEGSD